MQGRVTWPVCLSFAFLRSVINISGAALAGSCWSSSTSIAANKKPTPPPRFCERAPSAGGPPPLGHNINMRELRWKVLAILDNTTTTYSRHYSRIARSRNKRNSDANSHHIRHHESHHQLLPRRGHLEMGSARRVRRHMRYLPRKLRGHL